MKQDISPIVPILRLAKDVPSPDLRGRAASPRTERACQNQGPSWMLGLVKLSRTWPVSTGQEIRGGTYHNGEYSLHQRLIGGVKLGLADGVLKQICEHFMVLRIDTARTSDTTASTTKPFL